MGHFAFENPSHAPAEWQAAIAGAWLLNGYDHWPIPSERSESEGGFVLKRGGKESAILSVLAPDVSGARTVSTSTLRPNEKPYRVVVELARGALNRLRNLAEAMTSARILIPAELDKRVLACTGAFGRVVSGEPGEQQHLAISAIGEALAVSDAVMSHLADRRLRARVEDAAGLGTRFGCVLRSPLGDRETDAFCSIFNAVQIPAMWERVEAVESHFDWSHLDRMIEWAMTNRLPIILGPVIDFSQGGMPSWLYQQSDLPLLAAFMDDFLGTIVARYGRYASTIQAFAGLNSREEFDLVEDDRLRLAARLLESAAQINCGADWSYTLREPFGDYLREGNSSYSPLVFADTLIRSGHETSSVALDVDSGDAHDPLDLLPMIDHFSSLVQKLSIEMGGNRSGRTAAHSVCLLQTALSSEGVEAVTWSSWSSEQNPGASESSLLFDGNLSPLGREFQTVRSRWWQAPATTP